jgi:glucose-1-phosphate adenylyltransferase
LPIPTSPLVPECAAGPPCHGLCPGRRSRQPPDGADRHRRAKPAVYFGGKSRIIDFALSNAVNSGIRRIGVATQYKAHSLIRHLQRGWNFFRPERNESFDILPASQRVSEDQWYLGTADAVYQNLDIIEAYDTRATSSCWPATTSTRWTTRSDAAAARRAPAPT